ncbi:MAG: hypothetical protein K2K82_04410, partial [Muribaculaceae bacterium]|nr:hypothetical protein [Muribaculaceae bacterium]
MRKQVRFLSAIIVAFGMTGVLHAQEKSSKFAHVSLPDEVKAVAVSPHKAFAHGDKKLWRINTDNWTVEQVADFSDHGWSAQVQGVASDANDVYFYVGSEGVYQMPVDGTEAKIVTPVSDDFKRNYEEAY